MEGFHVDSSNHQVAGAQEGLGEGNLDSHGIGRVLQADGS
jgi:hypothetical protein